MHCGLVAPKSSWVSGASTRPWASVASFSCIGRPPYHAGQNRRRAIFVFVFCFCSFSRDAREGQRNPRALAPRSTSRSASPRRAYRLGISKPCGMYASRQASLVADRPCRSPVGRAPVCLLGLLRLEDSPDGACSRHVPRGPSRGAVLAALWSVPAWFPRRSPSRLEPRVGGRGRPLEGLGGVLRGGSGCRRRRFWSGGGWREVGDELLRRLVRVLRVP